MIIGIDEVGDFSNNSSKINFFLAAKFDQDENRVDKKKQQFDNWKNSIPKAKINTHNEVKGTDLSDEELLKFAKEVISAEPPVRLNIIQFITAHNSVSIALKFKEIELKRLQKIVAYYTEQNKNSIAKQYQELVYWYKNHKKMNYQHYIKILLLNKLIPIALEDAIGISILLWKLRNINGNLLNIKIKIDRDFINGPQSKIFWKEILRNALYSYSREKPFPLLEEWKVSGHPFIDKYLMNGKLDFKDILQNQTDFVQSYEHFEVQIADIAGNIIHRFKNKQKCIDAYWSLWEWNNKEAHPIQIELNPDFDTSTEIVIL